MHPSHNRSKRRRGKIDNNDDDGLPAHVPRLDDTQSDAYSRRPHSHQQTDSYVPSSSRTSFGMGWEGPSSRSDSAADRLHSRSSDVHYRGGRDSHDLRDDDSWPVHPKNDWHHQPNKEWATRDFDQGPPEPQNWGASTSYTDRGRSHGWQPDDRRGSKTDERGTHTRPSNDSHHNRRRNNRKFQRDNGWESRKGKQHRKQDVQDDPPGKDERSWEPGPGWQARGEQWNNRNRNNGNKNKNKKNQNKNRFRMEKERDGAREREVQHDDDDLNKYIVFML